MKQNNKVIFITLILALGGYYFLNFKYNLSISCLFHKLTSYYCPGCGITRMFFSMIRLDFYQAFRYNPLIFIILIAAICYLLIMSLLKRKIIISDKVKIYIIILLIVYGVLRNIDIFSFLAPTII